MNTKLKEKGKEERAESTAMTSPKSSSTSSTSSMTSPKSSVRIERESSYRYSDSATPLPFEVIVDRFETLAQVRTAIKEEGLRDCGLIIGIDYTLSNKIQGQQTFNGKSLHHIDETSINPYQEVICILGECLEEMNHLGVLPVFGFGDHKVKDKSIFALKEGECEGFADVLDAYDEITPTIKLGGPTNFAPLIEEAINIVRKTKKYHILAIVADGQVTNEDDTIAAIVEASNYPLSITMIGVGDGPWEVMKEFDDKLPERRFDNFQFVEFHKVKSENRNPQAALALATLMLIPDQYKTVRDLKLMDSLR